MKWRDKIKLMLITALSIVDSRYYLRKSEARDANDSGDAKHSPDPFAPQCAPETPLRLISSNYIGAFQVQLMEEKRLSRV